jgi:RecA-family ATPase
MTITRESSSIIDFAAAMRDKDKTSNLPPLPFAEMVPNPPPREWFLHERILANVVALFSGDGAAGKSFLLLQLFVAAIIGRDWLGLLPKQGPVIYFCFEDDAVEINRRLAAICRHYQVSLDDVKKDLHIVSMVDDPATALATFDHNGILHPTLLFKRLLAAVEIIRPVVIGLDTLTDVFGGNELVRSHAKHFTNLLRSLGTTVIVLSHPSLAGIASGSGLSGSTGWHTSVRARMYLRSAEDKGEHDDTDLRILEFKKNNYGPVSERILLRWKDGVYVREPSFNSLEKLAADTKVETLFLDILRRLTKQGRNVSEHKGTSYAPAIFEGEPEAKAAKVARKQLTEAMTRLFAADKIKIVTEGPPSHRRSRLVEV